MTLKHLWSKLIQLLVCLISVFISCDFHDSLFSGQTKICICVRKRPISSKEVKKSDHDSVTCVNPLVIVHDCKLKIDGISKYLDNTSFEFDNTFHEDDTTGAYEVVACSNLLNLSVRQSYDWSRTLF